MDNYSRSWGRVIKRQRIALGLSQVALAEKLEVTQSAVSQWERGYVTPSTRLQRELVSLLGIAPDELYHLMRKAA